MKGVIFTPDRNTKRADYTGAFLPEALAYAKVHGLPDSCIVPVDITANARAKRLAVIDAIQHHGDAQEGLDAVAFFCHGWKHGIQLGFERQDTDTLARVLRPYAKSSLSVPLYACSTGRDGDWQIADDMDPDTIGGDGGFADELRDSLCAEAYAVRCRVLAHVTAGHTTLNPWVRFFDGNNMPYGGSGGYWPIRPHGPLWRAWVRWLREDSNRFWMPHCSLEQIRADVTRRV